MTAKARCWHLGICLMFGLVVPATAKEPEKSTKGESTEALRAEIGALKADKVAWREIVWKSCLLEGLSEARSQNKPVLLWVFIDRPADDARC